MTIRLTRQIVPTALMTAVFALAFPAAAAAQPNTGEWDIGAYDQCIGSFDGNPLDSPAEHKRWEDHMKMCCEKTGGIFNYPPIRHRRDMMCRRRAPFTLSSPFRRRSSETPARSCRR